MTAKSAAAARKGRSLPMSKRRGRPPRPPATAPPRRAAEDRRNLRPRRRRPLLDDYSGLSSSSDEEEEEVEEKGRRKLKLVLKLPPLPAKREEAAPISRHRKLISGRHVSDSYPLSPSSSSSSSYVEDEEEEDENREEVEEEEEEEEAIKPPKKRRIDSSDERIGAHGSRNREIGKTNLVPRLKVEGVISGLSAKPVKRTPLPDRKALEAILDKLQKKDTYRVFAQPVDPEELPDYHVVIEHPMDFGTVRKKLGRNVYRSFEQFEDDVFLICSNAMQYNAPDTVYFRQARSIQDMAREKFQKLRDDQKRDDQKLRDNGMFSEIEGKSEEKIRISSLEKQPLKTSISRTGQEPLGSDISSATTLGSTGEAVTGLSTTKANATEPPIAVNGSVDKSCSLGGSKSEKADELSARSFPIELLRKSPVVDENRRATYNISEQQPSMESDPVFDIFESEPKQLVDVGLHAEHSYARSLACFAATLGPMAWKIAAENIEKALPAGIKFGPGWVGEYEPLPTAVLSLENHSQHQLGYNSNLHNKAAPKRVTGVKERPKAAANGNSEDIHLGLRSRLTTGNSTRVPNPMKKNCHGDTAEMKQRVSGFTSEHHPTSDDIRLHKKNEQVTANYANYAKAHSTVANQMKGFCSSSLSSPIATTQRPESSEGTASKMHEIVSCGRSTPQPKQFLKPPDRVSMHSTNKTTGIDIGGLNDGRFLGSSNSNRPTNAMGFISKHQSGMTSNFLNQGRQQQNANDTAELMGLPSLICSQTGNSNNGNDTPRKLVPMFPSTVGENHSIAASAAAQAWMSLGASFENRPLVDSQRFPSSQVRSASDNTSAWRTLNTDPKNYNDSRVRNVSQFFRQPIQVVNAEPQVHHRGLVIFPQLIASDLSRSHGSSQWQGLVPHTQNKQKRDTLPPDLNISFQAPASPVGQSAGVHLDAQQPDLALQL